MITLYHSDPSTGEVFETKEVATPEEKEFAMSRAGGLWYETPRWHTNPRPSGLDSKNPYERVNVVPYEEFPRVLYKKSGVDLQTKAEIYSQLKVANADEKRMALKNGYCLIPNEAHYREKLAPFDKEAIEAAAEIAAEKAAKEAAQKGSKP